MQSRAAAVFGAIGYNTRFLTSLLLHTHGTCMHKKPYPHTHTLQHNIDLYHNVLAENWEKAPPLHELCVHWKIYVNMPINLKCIFVFSDAQIFDCWLRLCHYYTLYVSVCGCHRRYLFGIVADSFVSSSRSFHVADCHRWRIYIC